MARKLRIHFLAPCITIFSVGMLAILSPLPIVIGIVSI